MISCESKEMAAANPRRLIDASCNPVKRPPAFNYRESIIMLKDKEKAIFDFLKSSELDYQERCIKK